jgi:MFS family permease
VSLVLVPAQTMSQQGTPREMMGRVSSSLLSLVSLAQVLGLLLSGYLAQVIGIRPFFLTGSGGVILLAILGYVWIQGKKTDFEEQGIPGGSH